MEKDNIATEADVSTPSQMEDTMEAVTEPITAQPGSPTRLPNRCTHSRAIDDVLTRGRKRSGKVRCLECNVIFDDPYLTHE